MMKFLEKPDQEPEPIETEKVGKNTKLLKSFSKVRRELTEEELMNNSAAIRLLLAQLDQGELQVAELSEFQNKFHGADKNVAVLEEHLKTSKVREACLAIGALLIGLTPSYDFIYGAGKYFFFVGVVLIIVGVVWRGKLR